MNSRLLGYILPALLGVSLHAAAIAHAQTSDLASVIAGMQRRYAAVESVRAEFTQKYHAPGIEQTESGTMYMKKPGLMRWEYRDPEVKLFVADGRNTYLYTPEERQVVIQKFTSEDLRGTPLQFLLGQGDIRREFEVAWEAVPAPGAADYLIRLTPRAAGSEYAFIVVACDRGSFDLRRLAIGEHSGNISEFLFRNLQVNGKLDGRQFEFRIPKGVEVIRLDEK
jgi:outer membrane lipoprotein carrier protein